MLEILNNINEKVKNLNSLKIYYKIGEVSKITCMSQSLIRRYENVFNFKIKRNNRKDRIYKLNDIKKFLLIKHLMYVEGYSLFGTIRQFDKYELRTWK